MESCLKQLVELANQDDKEFKPIEDLQFTELPNLPPILDIEVEELQKLCFQEINSHMEVDGFVDSWIRTAEKKVLLQDLWNERTLSRMRDTFKVDLVPLNKVWPNIPQ